MQTQRNTFWFNEINFTSDILLYLLYACCNQESEEDEEEKESEKDSDVALNDSSDVNKEEEEDEEGDCEVGVKEFDNRVSV